MRLDYKSEIKVWSIYFFTILLSVYIHEVGHCIPAKEYISDDISLNLQQRISLGGIMGTVLFTVFIFILYLKKSVKYGSAILAGAIAVPGIYTLRFFLEGRGHDATEFQEAQSALGFNYSGHSLDWLFLAILILGGTLWIVKSKPSYKVVGRILIGIVLTVIFIVGLQVLNNAIFDPIFKS